jgi:hypothetical protein
VLESHEVHQAKRHHGPNSTANKKPSSANNFAL